MSAAASIATKPKAKNAFSTMQLSTAAFYLSGDAALNLRCPEGTSGGWHAPSIFNDAPRSFPFAGDGPSALVNTNDWFGSDGVYDCTAQIRQYYPTQSLETPVYAANHYRALLDKVLAFAIKYNRVPAPVPLHDYLDADWQVAGLMEFIANHRKALPVHLAKAIDAWVANLNAYEAAGCLNQSSGRCGVGGSSAPSN